MGSIFALRMLICSPPLPKTNASCTVEEAAYIVRTELEAFWFVFMVILSTSEQ